MATWTPPVRNMDGIEHEEVRKAIDDKFNQCHDVLTACYYGKQKFVWNGTDYGILDKATYDELHGLIFHHREIEFHDRNVAAVEAKTAVSQAVGKAKTALAAAVEFEPVPEDKYRYIDNPDGTRIDKVALAQAAIDAATRKLVI